MAKSYSEYIDELEDRLMNEGKTREEVQSALNKALEERNQLAEVLGEDEDLNY